MTPSDKETLLDALNHYGIENQVNQTIEEMAELTQALSKWRRKYHDNPKKWQNRATPNLAEEMADVRNMFDQLLLKFKGLEEEIEKYRRIKLNRLAAMIGKKPNNKKGAKSIAYLRGTAPEEKTIKNPQLLDVRLDKLLSLILDEETYLGELYRIVSPRYPSSRKTFTRDLKRLAQNKQISLRKGHIQHGRTTFIRKIKIGEKDV